MPEVITYPKRPRHRFRFWLERPPRGMLVGRRNYGWRPGLYTTWFHLRGHDERRTRWERGAWWPVLRAIV